MDAQRLEITDPRYPARLLTLESPPALTAIGSLELLQAPSWLAVFCSSRCPGTLIIAAQDVAQQLVQRGTAVIGGFHSPVEREMLRVLLRGTQPIIIVPARGLMPYRVPPEYNAALEGGRLLLLSPFPDAVARSSTRVALQRNLFVSDFADSALVIHASDGSATEKLARDTISKKTVWTLPDDANAGLLELGALKWQSQQ